MTILNQTGYVRANRDERSDFSVRVYAFWNSAQLRTHVSLLRVLPTGQTDPGVCINKCASPFRLLCVSGSSYKWQMTPNRIRTVNVYRGIPLGKFQLVQNSDLIPHPLRVSVLYAFIVWRTYARRDASAYREQRRRGLCDCLPRYLYRHVYARILHFPLFPFWFIVINSFLLIYRCDRKYVENGVRYSTPSRPVLYGDSNGIR